MSNDSKLLLNRLELNLQKGGGESEEMSDIDNIFSKPIFNNVNASKPLVGGGGLLDVLSETETKEIKNDLSDTSPFISSEMYNLLMKNNNEVQQGGSIQKGGKIEGDDSSTSSTSSSNDNSDDSDDSSSESEKKKKQNKKGKKNLKGGKKIVSESSNSNELSYISSSAHTGKSDENSESPSVSASSVKSKSSKKSNSVEDYESSSDNYITSEKSTIKNLNNNLPNSSINTSDINMITE